MNNNKLLNHRKIKLISVFFLFALISITATINAQTQKGLDIDGEAAFDQSGWSVSMPDSSTLAISAPRNYGNGSASGHVRVYSWNGSAWQQKGHDIDGEAVSDWFGSSVSMPDSSTVAIGASANSGNGYRAGHVRVYGWNGSAWQQKGADIDGEAANDNSGGSVSMPDSNTVAIGAIGNKGNGFNAGHVRIYRWNGSAWQQKGSDIDGETLGDMFGQSVSMSDSNTVAIGGAHNNGNGQNSGHVRVYSWNGSSWVQKGADIDGEAAGDLSGRSVSMSDSNTIAIGAIHNYDRGNQAGHVRVYSWNGSSWVQKGIDIDGEAAGDLSGVSVSMPDSSTLAIGAFWNDGNGSYAGQVRVYSWNGSAWQQLGVDIDGEAADDWFGFSVSMPHSNTLAAGAYFNDGNGSDAGHVRVYSLSSIVVDNQEKELLQSGIKIYPNPVGDYLSIEVKEFVQNPRIRIRNVNGQLVYDNSNLHKGNNQIDFSNWAKGVYFVRIISDDFDQAVKIVKQ